MPLAMIYIVNGWLPVKITTAVCAGMRKHYDVTM